MDGGGFTSFSFSPGVFLVLNLAVCMPCYAVRLHGKVMR